MISREDGFSFMKISPFPEDGSKCSPETLFQPIAVSDAPREESVCGTSKSDENAPYTASRFGNRIVIRGYAPGGRGNSEGQSFGFKSDAGRSMENESTG